MKLNEIKTFTISLTEKEGDIEKAVRLAKKRIKTLTMCKDEDILHKDSSHESSLHEFTVTVNISNIDL